MREAIGKVLICFGIALLPFYVKVAEGDMTRLSKDLLFVSISFLLSILLPRRRSLPSKYIILILVASFMLTFNQYSPSNILLIMQVIYIFSGVALTVALIESVDDSYSPLILNSLVVGGVIQSLVAMGDYFQLNFNLNFYKMFYPSLRITNPMTFGWGQSIGTLGNTNLLSAYMALSAFACLRHGFKKYLIPIGFILISTNVAMGIASFLAGGLFLLVRKYNLMQKSTIYFMAITSMVPLACLDVGIDSGRFRMWRENLSVVDLGHFLIGKGPAWYGSKTFMISSSHYMQQEHNEFLALFNIFGIGGVLFLLYLIYKHCKNEHESDYMAAFMFIIFCNSYGHFTFHQSTYVFPAICLLAVYLKSTRGFNEFNVERKLS